MRRPARAVAGRPGGGSGHTYPLVGGVFAFAVALTTPAAYALQICYGQTVTIEKGVTIDDDLIVTGRAVGVGRDRD